MCHQITEILVHTMSNINLLHSEVESENFNVS
jgi:hypothetical protein